MTIRKNPKRFLRLIKFYYLLSGNQTVLYLFWPFFKTIAPFITGYIAFGQILEQNTGRIPYDKWIASGAFSWALISGSVTTGLNLFNSPVRRRRFQVSNIGTGEIVIANLFLYLVISLITLIYILPFAFEINHHTHYLIQVSQIILLVFYFYIISTASTIIIGIFSAITRDIKMITPWLTQLMLFTAPVFYAARTPNSLLESVITNLNPLAHLLSLTRMVIFGIQPTNIILTLSFNIFSFLFSYLIVKNRDTLIMKLFTITKKQREED